MMLVGFGYLMAFLKFYGLGAVGFTFVITCLALQVNILLRPLIPRGDHLIINSMTLLDGHFGAATVLISFGALIGKASPTQLVVVTVLESLLFQVNRNIICEEELQFADTGGTIVIHLFGAYFGLACAYVLGKPPDNARTAAMASTSMVSDLLSLIGTVFLWIYWPTFNGGAYFSDPKYGNVCITNTVVALSASCIASFSLSGLMGGRFAPSHVQNATLAGGVAVGAIASLEMGLATSAVLGAFGGMLSTLGYQKLQPYLYEKIGLHDSCGVHNLHGLPGLFGSLASVVACAVHHDPTFHPNDKSTQALNQLWATIISLILALVGGAFTGLVVKLMGRQCHLGLAGQEFFIDAAYWSNTDGSKYGMADFLQKEVSYTQERRHSKSNSVSNGGTTARVTPKADFLSEVSTIQGGD